MLTKFWSNLTSFEIDKLDNKRILIFPFSSIEQHGNHLPVGTDKFILDGILDAFVRKYPKLNNFIIMPNIYFGSASEHLQFKGTISINSSRYIDYVVDIVDQFCANKHHKFIFLNSHGGQTSHLDIVSKELKSKYPSIDIVKANYFLFKGFENIISEKELNYGYHGGEFETSLMLYLKPNLVKMNKILKNYISSDYNSKKLISYEMNIKRAWNTKDLSKNGIIGNPIDANADKGKKILNLTIDTLSKIIKEIS